MGTGTAGHSGHGTRTTATTRTFESGCGDGGPYWRHRHRREIIVGMVVERAIVGIQNGAAGQPHWDNGDDRRRKSWLKARRGIEGDLRPPILSPDGAAILDIIPPYYIEYLARALPVPSRCLRNTLTSRQYTENPTDLTEQALVKGQEGHQEKGRRPFHP
jgi:hypothetical protein